MLPRAACQRFHFSQPVAADFLGNCSATCRSRTHKPITGDHERGSFLLDEPDAGVGDGRFKGYAVNTEVGVTVYPHPQVGIVLGYGYRPIWFDRATGMTDTPYELRPRFRESSRGVIFTTPVTF